MTSFPRKYIRAYACAFFIMTAASSTMQGQSLEQQFEKLMFSREQQQDTHAYAAHSHNDYWQPQPFFTAYYAGMQSIEADVFLQDGELMVAHDKHEITKERTLRNLYLDPVAKLYQQNGGHAFRDSSKKLQLLIDVKENYRALLPILIKQLESYGPIFNPVQNPNAIKIIISGSRPRPEGFKEYPSWLLFDGEVDWTYDDSSLAQTALISAGISDYTDWNGKGLPDNVEGMQRAIAKADSLGLPFRFYGTHDGPNSWLFLINQGVYWINTDQPKALEIFLKEQPRASFQAKQFQPTYQPSFQHDGADRPAKRILLLIGDGMGLSAVKAAKAANGGKLSMTNMRATGLLQTEALNTDNTDSAAGGSAIATGRKTNNRAIAVDENGKPQSSVASLLSQKGWKTAIISTGDITDATPAVFYGHHIERNESRALLDNFPQSGIDILIGGTPSWAKRDTTFKGYPNIPVTKNILRSDADRQIVFLADSLTRPVKDGRKDILLQSLKGAITHLSHAQKPYFIMAESAQIDYAGHANDVTYSITEILDLDMTVSEVLKMVDADPEMLVIVTADHETGGMTVLDSDYRKGRVRVQFSSNDHTNDFVPVFAYGARSFLFQGVYDNTEVFHKLLKAAEQQEIK